VNFNARISHKRSEDEGLEEVHYGLVKYYQKNRFIAEKIESVKEKHKESYGNRNVIPVSDISI
jgi:hypothetical protein